MHSSMTVKNVNLRGPAVCAARHGGAVFLRPITHIHRITSMIGDLIRGRRSVTFARLIQAELFKPGPYSLTRKQERKLVQLWTKHFDPYAANRAAAKKLGYIADSTGQRREF